MPLDRSNRAVDSSDGTLESDTWTYEETVAKAENIVSQMQSGKVSLEELHAQYSLLSEYLQQCENFLQRKRQIMDGSAENFAVFTLQAQPSIA